MVVHAVMKPWEIREKKYFRSPLLLFIGGTLDRSAAGGAAFSPAATFAAIHVLSPQCGADHGPGTPVPALHLDCLDRAVECTRPTLHAGHGSGEFGVLVPFV